MKYIVYLTTNKINNKIYIGVHGTEDPDIWDHYLGDGTYDNKSFSYNSRKTPFKCAVAKYGPSNFVRMVLKAFDTEQEALELEAHLVNEEFIKRKDTYNITLGGGKPPVNRSEIFQYDLQGNFIKKWPSIKSITDNYSINKDRIRMVIDTKCSFMACYWSEEELEKLDVTEYRPSARGCIFVYTVGGHFIGVYKSQTEVRNQFGVTKKDLVNAITRKGDWEGYYFLKEGESIQAYMDGSIKQNLKVYQYNSTGECVRVFKNISEAKKEYKINKNDLKRAIKNNAEIGGFYWSYDAYNNIIEENPNISVKFAKHVYQYTLDGKFVKEWKSMTACRKEFPSVMQVLLGKRNHCHGFTFSYDKVNDIVQSCQ